MKGAQNQASGSILACLHADGGKVDAMVHGVAYQMGERVLDRLDDGLVEFGLFALHLDVDFLAATEGHVPHRAGKLAPDVSDGLQPGPRTVRGNWLQMFPMGCSRVFMTSPCSSVAIRFMRCETACRLVSSNVFAICKSWLRASTSSPTRVISLSNTVAPTRMVSAAVS